MAQTNAIVWRHFTAIGNAAGVAWVQANSNPGKHVVCAGGWAQPIGANEANATNTSTSTDNATGVVPIAGTNVEYDSPSDSTYMSVGFAVPEGAKVRAHVWCILAPGESN